MHGLEQTEMIVFEILLGPELAGFALTEIDAQEIMSHVIDRFEQPASSVAIRQLSSQVTILPGEIAGTDIDAETVHVIFQFPCGKWVSEGYRPSHPDQFITSCGCKKCGPAYFLIKYPPLLPLN
ncbi:MAG: hypothetical protein V4719_14955 [Planctomycetota bacterium]